VVAAGLVVAAAGLVLAAAGLVLGAAGLVFVVEGVVFAAGVVVCAAQRPAPPRERQTINDRLSCFVLVIILIFSLVVLIGLIEDRATFPAKVLPPKACFGPAEDSFEDGNGIGVVLSSLGRDVQSNFLFGPANVFAFYVELRLDFAGNGRTVLDRQSNNRTLFPSRSFS
jgi:hypothetical protein